MERQSPVILLVEDDSETREAMEEFLTSRRFLAAGVGSAREAKHVLRFVRGSSEPDLMRLAVVVISGIEEAEALSPEADAFFAKPIQTESAE